MPSGRLRLWIAGMIACSIFIASCSDDESKAEPKPMAQLVGRAACAKCHDAQHSNWSGSHHDLAMQEATADTVLGNFDDAEFTHHGVTSRFFRRDDKFMVRTDGPDGELTDYEVTYVFGVDPLQQYLIEFSGGRFQALSMCWDSRPADEGGQRWYHVYGDEKIPHDDELHWTRRSQNWNYMCASCHSTGLQKGYDLASDSYRTTWFEIDVSCEACHGAGSHHVAWADAGGSADDTDKGLSVKLKNPAVWKFVDGAVTAQRDPPLPAHTQTETCAPCHARRSVVDEQPHHGRPLHDSFRVSLLDEGLYHADGQILDEVYVYGSFAQSRMYHAGVTCSDCHEPHSLEVRAPGNALCAQCHMPTAFDSKAHHMHEPGSAGAQCVACHMPERKYMVVDGRADHSIRIPRPDLTVKLGTPNACTGCHDDKDASWAAEAIRSNNPSYTKKPHYAEAIHAGRRGSVGASAALARLVDDGEQPAIARATAVSLLHRYPSRETLTTLQPALSDPSATVRAAAIGALDGYPMEVLVQQVAPLLEDPVLAVRIEAARVLAAWTTEAPATIRARLNEVVEEYVQAQLQNSDQPWAHVNIGLVRTPQGRFQDATQAYRTALRIDSSWTPAWANLADLYRAQQRDDLGERVLREGLEKASQTADLRYGLGLLLARIDRQDEAIIELERAATESPDRPLFAYTHGVALHSAGQIDRALQVLEQAQGQHPRNRELLTALVTMNRDRGAWQAAIGWAQRLVALAPGDPEANALLRSLQQGR